MSHIVIEVDFMKECPVKMRDVELLSAAAEPAGKWIPIMMAMYCL
jgi:hypothetical protein